MSSLYHLSPLWRSAVVLFAVFATGTVGYRIIGGSTYTLLDCAYMTAITLTTLGYHEVVDLSQSPYGKLFTMALLFVGVGSMLYFFTAITEFAVEGSLSRVFWRRRMMNMVNALRGHYVVCGGGKTGEHVIRELIETQRQFLLIETDLERVDHLHEKLDVEFPVVIGDATEDESLLAAGLDRAAGLVTCMGSDNDNLVTVFSARNLNQHLRIVCRSSEERMTLKLRRAGADAVVSPDRIGGLRLISEMVRPTVVSFLDSMLRDHNSHLRVDEVEIQSRSKLDDATIGDFRNKAIAGLTLIGTGTLDGGWTYKPTDESRLSAGVRIIFIGEPSTRQEVEKLAASPATSVAD